MVELLGVHDGLPALIVGRGGGRVDAARTGDAGTGSGGTSAEASRASTRTRGQNASLALTVRLGARPLGIKDTRAGRTGPRAETASSDARVVAGSLAETAVACTGSGSACACTRTDTGQASTGTSGRASVTSVASVARRAEAVIVGQLVGASRTGTRRVVAACAARGSDPGTDVGGAGLVLVVGAVVVRGTSGTGASEGTAGGRGESSIAGTVAVFVRVGAGGRSSGEVLAKGSDTGTGAVGMACTSA